MKKRFYNPELNSYDVYEEVWISERVNVKDEKGLLVKNHYWKDSSGELWADFDNPMENVYESFKAYRKKKSFLTPNQIKGIRNDLNLSVREFANILGISSSTLTKIENNHRIQTKYQDQLFKLVALNKNNLNNLVSTNNDDAINNINSSVKENKYFIKDSFYNEDKSSYEIYGINRDIGVIA
ncbi:helix-turn-helix domain-containing protein [Lactobacillus rodentium]|uniref:HTH cro/C1-type domain-containing protein n=1 Tax=Lactobacillus rodentium TaxID=947835 RepID=A0A2Z6T815_9LACO|nr:helix-turn-helix domain-containing protein [Lactobacillus rodentium]MCR1894132.1 helix-turn-helix domain-containing protein [Lactobacillus rodentium]GBG04428.1 hypothetical protein LrDSM24759_03420 [Lactobacillus rodentium]